MADVHIGHLHNEQAIAFANMGRVTALHGVVVARRVTKWSIHSPSWGWSDFVGADFLLMGL